MVWAWLAWEAAVLAAAVRVARLCDCKYQRSGEFLVVLAGADICISASLASAFSFARINHPAAYLSAAGLLLAVLFFSGRGRAWAEVWSRLQKLTLFSHPFLLAALAAGFVPLVFLSARPVQEADSLYYLHYLLEWMSNRATPYQFVLSYVPFWELNFLPGLVLTRSDVFFAPVAFKALALFGGAVFLAASEFGMPPRLSMLLVANVLALRHLWWEHAGVSTLKNDTLHGAGAVLLAVALLRASRGRAAGAWILALGVTFACVKYSGPVLVALVLPAYCYLARPRPRVLAGVGLFVLACSGHYYLRNLLAHGNPLYPFEIPFLHLAGTADLSYTSILYNLGDLRLWRAFFWPQGGLSPAGLLFPVTLAASLLVAAFVMGSGLTGRLRGRALKPDFWIATFLLAGWLVYFRSLFSASSRPGDLAYVVNSLNSLRYAEGILGISELWLASLLLIPAGALGVALAAALSLASRLWLLYRAVPQDLFSPPLMATVCAGVAVLLFSLGQIRRPGLRAALMTGALLLPVVFGSPLLVERNRAHWADWWKEIYGALREAPASSVFLVEDPRAGYAAGHFLLAGKRLQHDVTVGPESEADVRKPNFLVRLVNPHEPKPDFDAFATRFSQRGYEPVIRGENGVLLQRMERIPAAGRLRGWLMESGSLPWPGGWLDRGGAARSPARSRLGDVLISAGGGHLFLLEPSGTKHMQPREATRITVLNCGPLDAAGQPRGLDYIWSSAGWAPVLDGIPRLNPDHDFRQALRGGALVETFASASKGKPEIALLDDEAGARVRLRAAEAADWLVLVHSIPKLGEGAPLTVRAQVRCPQRCVLSVVGPQTIEKHGAASGEWQTLTLTLRLPPGDPGYCAIGLQKSPAGAGFEVREFSLLHGRFPSLTGR